MNILIAVIFILIGLIGIFAKDWAWEWDNFKNRQAGLKSQRTEEWNASSTIGGCLFIIIGVVSLVLIFLTK